MLSRMNNGRITLHVATLFGYDLSTHNIFKTMVMERKQHRVVQIQDKI